MRTFNNKRFKKLLSALEVPTLLLCIAAIFIACNSAHKERIKSQSLAQKEILMDTVQEDYSMSPREEQETYKSIAMDLIKESEGFSNRWYICPAGKRTIGYGFTNIRWSGNMSKNKANEILYNEYDYYRGKVIRLVKNENVEERHIASLTSFAYNVGLGSFKESKILRYINSGQIDKARAELPKWIYIKTASSKKKVNGLIKRRKKELRLWDQELS